MLPIGPGRRSLNYGIIRGATESKECPIWVRTRHPAALPGTPAIGGEPDINTRKPDTGIKCPLLGVKRTLRHDPQNVCLWPQTKLPSTSQGRSCQGTCQSRFGHVLVASPARLTTGSTRHLIASISQPRPGILPASPHGAKRRHAAFPPHPPCRATQ